MYGGMELTSKDKILNDKILRRYEIVQSKLESNLSVNVILEKYKICRYTLYTYLSRFKKYGVFGLRDHSRAPKQVANKTPKKDEEELIRLHNQYPYMSSYELSEICNLNYKTIQRIRKRNNFKKVYMPKGQKKTMLKKLKKRYQKVRNEILLAKKKSKK